MNPDVFIYYLKQKIFQCGSQKAFAARLGISEQYLTDVLKRRREPGEKILKPLGFRRIVTYERVEQEETTP